MIPQVLPQHPQAVDVHIDGTNAIGGASTLFVTTGQFQPLVETQARDVPSNVQAARLGRLEFAATQRQHPALQVPGVAVTRKHDVPADAAVRRAAALDVLSAGHERDIALDFPRSRGGLYERFRQADLHPDEVAGNAHRERRGYLAAAAREQQVDDIAGLAINEAGDRQAETFRQALRVDGAAGTSDNLEARQ